jgi:O-antigen/teichoic acid export membrane protein
MSVILLLKKSSFFMSLRIFGIGLSFLMFAALSRNLDERSFGLFSIAFSTVLLLVPVLMLSRREIVERYIPHFIALEDTEAVENLIRDGWIIIQRLGGGAVCLSLPVAFIFWRTMPEVHLEDIFLIPASAFLLLGTMVADYQLHVLRGYGKISWAVVPRDVASRAGVAVMVVSASALGQSLNAVYGILLMGISLVTFSAIQAWFNRELLPTRMHERPKLPSNVARTARLIWLPNVMNTGYPNLVPLVVGLLISPVEGGVFFVAQRVANLMQIPHISGRAIAINAISGLYAKGELAEIQHKLPRLTGLISLASLLAFALIVSFSGTVLTFFNPTYADKAHILIIMSIGPLLNSMFGPLGVVLQNSGYDHFYARGIILANIVAIAALFVGLSLFGMTGAAWASTLQMLLWNIALWVLVRRVGAPDVSVVGLLFPIKFPAKKDTT